MNSPSMPAIVLPLTASERKYADGLDAAGIAWERPALYRFKFNGTSYTPDFFLPHTGQFVELIGTRSRRYSIAPKLAAFRQAFPQVDLVVVDVADEWAHDRRGGSEVKRVSAEARQAAAVLGRLGGLARTTLKARAARENGKLGGRPRKDTKGPAARKRR